MNTACENHTATLLQNGPVLVAGGLNNARTLSSAELYDSAKGKWTVTGSLSHTRPGYPARLLPNGEVLVAGGFASDGSVLSSAELYNPATGTWATTGSMNVAPEGHTATLLANGRVLIAGVGNNTGGSL